LLDICSIARLKDPVFFWDVNEQNQNYNFSRDSCVQCHLF
jgi:hypothetical protein